MSRRSIQRWYHRRNGPDAPGAAEPFKSQIDRRRNDLAKKLDDLGSHRNMLDGNMLDGRASFFHRFFLRWLERSGPYWEWSIVPRWGIKFIEHPDEVYRERLKILGP